MREGEKCKGERGNREERTMNKEEEAEDFSPRHQGNKGHGGESKEQGQKYSTLLKFCGMIEMKTA